MRSGAQDVAFKPLRVEEVVERLLALATASRRERRRHLGGRYAPAHLDPRRGFLRISGAFTGHVPDL